MKVSNYEYLSGYLQLCLDPEELSCIVKALYDAYLNEKKYPKEFRNYCYMLQAKIFPLLNN